MGKPRALRQGRNATSIYQELADRHGFAGSYQSVKRFARRLLAETWAATLMVVKFMLLAYTLEALIALYVPQELIVATLGVLVDAASTPILAASPQPK